MLLDVPLVLSWTLEMVYPTPSQSMKVMLSHTPSSVWTWLDVSSPTTSGRSSPREVTLSPPPPNVKSSVTSRKSFAMLPLTSNKKWPPQLPPPSNRCGSPSKNTTNAAHPLSTENAFKCNFLAHLVKEIYILILFVILVITNKFNCYGLIPLTHGIANLLMFVK